MKTNKLELKGQRFGHLTVIKELPERSFGHVQWECLCDCGKTITTRGVRLTGGTTKSCGHLNRSSLAGQQFGQLYVISELPNRHKGNVMWLCECDCGIRREVSSADLNAGRVTKCLECGHRYNKSELKGQRFGHLTVIKELPERRFGHVQWECLCDCGKTITARGVRLTGGTTKSCGHLNRSSLAGQQFGKLYVIAELPNRHKGNVMWLCECDCGITREVSSAALNAGRVTKCQVC